MSGRAAGRWGTSRPSPAKHRNSAQSGVCKPEYDGPARGFVLPFLKKGCHSFIEENGRTIREAFIHNIPRGLFILLPALALVMKAMYWRPRRSLRRASAVFRAQPRVRLPHVRSADIDNLAGAGVARHLDQFPRLDLHRVLHFRVDAAGVRTESPADLCEARRVVLCVSIGFSITVAVTSLYSVYSV